MPEHEARVRAFYDHEAEGALAAGHRRRQVADWGVGEDAFDRLPSRRFGRAESAHARAAAEFERAEEAALAERADDGPVAEVADLAARRARSAPRAASAEPADAAEREERRPDVPRGGVDDGRRTIIIGEPREDEERVGGVDGRRTIVIGARSTAPARRRPSRTAVERVGARPDRIVAYAVALGVLLILIAILSAGH